MQWGLGISLIQGIQGTVEQWGRQGWPWHPGGRQHVFCSSQSLQAHGDEAGEGEEVDLGLKLKRGRGSGGHLAGLGCC